MYQRTRKSAIRMVNHFIFTSRKHIGTSKMRRKDTTFSNQEEDIMLDFNWIKLKSITFVNNENK